MATSTKIDREAEQLLISRAKQNDQQAWEQLYRQHLGRVYALCLRLLGDPDQAEDMVQEAFVLAWRKLSGFRGDASFGSWLYRIAANVSVSWLRKQKVFRNSLDLDHLPETAIHLQPDLTMSLEAAIAKLPAGARAVFVLYSIEGYTHDEVASLLGIATGSSKTQLHRARQLLQAQLDSPDQG